MGTVGEKSTVRITGSIEFFQHIVSEDGFASAFTFVAYYICAMQ